MRLRMYAKLTETITCLGCGLVFMPDRRDRKYHSHECYWQNFHKRPESESVRKQMSERKRTPEAIRQLVRGRYPTEGSAKLAEELHKSKMAICCIAFSMGVRTTPETHWRIRSETCRARILANPPMNDPAARLKMSKTMKERHPDNPRNAKALLYQRRMHPTKPELKLQTILDSLGVVYEPGAQINPRLIVDFRIGRLIIQVDGEYWHGHPRFEPLTERQKTQRKKDAAQDTYMRACGYAVVRLWESDLAMDKIEKVLNDNQSAIQLPSKRLRDVDPAFRWSAWIS